MTHLRRHKNSFNTHLDHSGIYGVASPVNTWCRVAGIFPVPDKTVSRPQTILPYQIYRVSLYFHSCYFLRLCKKGLFASANCVRILDTDIQNPSILAFMFVVETLWSNNLQNHLTSQYIESDLVRGQISGNKLPIMQCVCVLCASPFLYCSNFIFLLLFLLLHRACCRVTQLLHQPLHIYKIYTLKH